MVSSYDLNSILEAIENINTKSTKLPIAFKSINEKIVEKNISANTDILPTTEKLILEAEEYSNKLKNKSLTIPVLTEDILILDNEYKEQDTRILDLEKIKLNIIDDLYSSLTKRVKKNTLKIIFDLRQKIINLEKEIEIINLNKTDGDYKKDNSIIRVNEEHLINEDYADDKNEFARQDNDSLSDSVIKSLEQKNQLIEKLEKSEKKLLLKIIDLEQDIFILGNKKKNTSRNTLKDSTDEFEKNIDTRYEVLDQQNSKTERELIFFKENYERLIIEKNEVKIKLSKSKERVIIFEKNIKELESGFETLSNILAKNSVINLSDPLLKLHTNTVHTKKDKYK